MAMFYLADRDVVRELLAASERGARVRLVLDPNKDAFGRTKDGVPNRQVADELVRRSRRAIEVRWYRTEGEQFHTKLVLVRTAAETFLSLGSANLTRRNLEDLNLEANVAVRAPEGSSLAREAGCEPHVWAEAGLLHCRVPCGHQVSGQICTAPTWRYIHA